MAEKSETQEELELLRNTTLYLNAKVLGLVLGFLFGTAILVATNWLILKGPQPNQFGQSVMGPHLALLGQYFIGYRVTFVGSMVGFVYAFAIGSFTGWLLAVIYNWVARFRN